MKHFHCKITTKGCEIQYGWYLAGVYRVGPVALATRCNEFVVDEHPNHEYGPWKRSQVPFQGPERVECEYRGENEAEGESVQGNCIKSGK